MQQPQPQHQMVDPNGMNAVASSSTGESKRDKKRREWVEKVETRHKDRMEDRDRSVDNLAFGVSDCWCKDEKGEEEERLNER
jgi:hypothetical protein